MNAFSLDQIGSMSPEQPCGVDLEYDVAFTALQQAATGVREQQFGDALIPAIAPTGGTSKHWPSSCLDAASICESSLC